MADSGYTVAQAYVQIMPSTQNFGKSLSNDIDPEVTSSGKSAGTSFTTAFKAALGITAVVSAAAAAATGELTKQAVEAYSSYEQLTGGVEKLFGEIASEEVLANASQAFETAGMSANDYMETVTNFSAALINSLDGDTQAAVGYADMAIRDMSDNANVFGTDITSIQNAYQGFAKGNFTMLDNLKLGYGGTKTEMERLITDAEKLDSSFVAARDTNGNLVMSYADIVDAIHIMQEDMNIAGTTAKEAASTIEGSVNSMKASWQNLLTGLGNKDADISKLVGDFTSSLETAAGNILPVIETALSNIGDALPEVISTLLPKLTQTITNTLPDLIDAIGGIVTSLIEALPDIVSGLVEALPDLIKSIFSNIGTIAGELIPALAESIGEVLLNLPSLLASTIEGIITGIGNMFTGIADAIDEAMSPQFTEGAFANTVSGMQTNAQKAFSDAANNLKTTWASIIGNTSWSDALNQLSLAEDALAAIYAEYDAFKKDLDEWSPEAATVDFEIKTGTVTSLVNQISNLRDANGGIIPLSQGGLLETLVDQINDLLGEEAITIEKATVITAVVQEVNTALEEGVDPVQAVLDWFGEQYPEWSEGGIPYDVLTSLSIEYNTTGISSQQSPEDFLNEKLTELGWDTATIESIVDIVTTDGEATAAWLGTENGAFASYIKSKLGLPDVEEITQVVDFIISEVENGKSLEDIETELTTYFGEDSEWTAEIGFTYDDTNIKQAIEDLEQLTIKTYAQQYAQSAMDYYMSAKEDWSDRMKAWTEAYDGYITAIEENDQNTATSLYSTMQKIFDSLTGLSGSAQEAVDSYIIAMYNLQQTDVSSMVADIEEVPAAFREEWGQMASDMMGFTSNYDDVKDAFTSATSDIVESSRTLGETTLENAGNAQAAAENLISTAGTWEEFQSMFGDAYGNIDALQGKVAEFMSSANSQMGTSSAYVLEWLQSIYGAQTYIPEFDMTVYEMADVISWLASNEDLAATATDGVAAAMDEASTTIGESSGEISDSATTAFSEVVDAASDTAEDVKSSAQDIVDNMATTISEGAPDIQDAAEDIRQGIGSTWTKQEMEATRVGTVMTSNLSGSMLSGLPGVEDAAESVSDAVTTAVENLPSDMTETGDSSASNLDTSFGDWSDTIWATVDDVYEIFNSAFNANGLQADMSTWGSKAGEKFDWGMGSTAASISQTALTIAQAVVAALSIAGSMYDVGYYAGQGFYNGLSVWGSSISDRAWTIANSVISATRSALQISSPSKVMEQIGLFTAEGFETGFEKGTGDILDSAASMTGGVIAAANDMVDGMNQIAVMTATSDLNRIDSSMMRSPDYRMDQPGAGTMEDYLTEILTALDRLSRMQMVTNNGVLVGELAEEMDMQLGAIRLQAERG